jgi:phosphate transport system substrate-binding protein
VESSRDVNLKPGTIVAGYRVVTALAEGGMGTVYEVEQIATGARRALKALHERYAGNEDLRARFVREARLTALIPSDHVAQVLDAGHDATTGTLYMVMELLEGVTLSREIRRRGAFAWTDTVEIIRQIAHALGAAHGRGIVHRDLKPANIFLSRSRHVSIPLTIKVLDFGIAKAIAGATPAGADGDAKKPDAKPTVLGTPAWMAPEQTVLGSPVGPQADVWALGLLAFLLLTGKHYFPSANIKNAPTDTLLREVVRDPIVPASRRAADVGCADRLPPNFDEWFARCVDRDPLARFEHASAAYEAFADLTPPLPMDPVPATIATDPPAAPTSGNIAIIRRDTPTAIDTPHAARVARVTNSTATAGTPQPQGPAEAIRSRTRSALALLSLALVVVAAIAAVAGIKAHRDDVLAAATMAMPSARSSRMIVRLHGSNTIGAELGPTLAEGFLRKRTGATVLRRRIALDELVLEARTDDGALEAIEVFAHGSSTSFADLAGGQCDIGMSSRRIHEDEVHKLSSFGDLSSAASEQVIALDGIAVIVNPQNALSLLTKAQIADVFSGRVRNWSDLGGPNLPITLYARDDKSGTYDSFKNMVLGSRPLAPEAKRFESSEELSDGVAADARAIGFIGLPYVRSAKAVMVQEAGSLPLLPSPMTVATEDYALARRLYLYIPLGASLVAHDFVDFVLSEEGQRLVEGSGFVDLRPECDANAAQCTAGCPAEYREAVQSGCRLSVNFRFDRGSTQLDTRALRDLQRIVALMGSSKEQRSLLLLGFSDARGTRGDNLFLSRQRADIVATQLRARGLRVGAARGFGPDMPVADDATEEGRERNRRVEVWLR